ncbi:hypothetical protein XBKQ1_2780046 [Xenorhabdus bovienii str. kraussei Quebec]|uniref:Uncharacterized protein n=1 Tax=Xenorhabdus bovienii str. kraussei Quebec TaxID=1398203 RepID=A0A077PJA2_XENBV|nr:hypothetical protein XBKQ1_2780046 [Xenorhabdus bovienii str. kraussei Quebec]
MGSPNQMGNKWNKISWHYIPLNLVLPGVLIVLALCAKWVCGKRVTGKTEKATNTGMSITVDKRAIE